MPEAYRQDAIRTPTDATLLRRLAELEGDVPAVGPHREAFRELGAEFVYTTRLDGPQFKDIDGAWIVLVRFGLTVETMFGLTREIPLVYTRHRDLQIRSFNALPAVIRSLPREVTNQLAFVSSPDPRQEQKLDDWSSPRLTGIALPREFASSREGWKSLLDLIERRLFTRDLYAETAPVTGTAFFGRQKLIQSIHDDVHARRVPGVFGLRKTGKTSLLKRVGELVETPRLCVRTARLGKPALGPSPRDRSAAP